MAVLVMLLVMHSTPASGHRERRFCDVLRAALYHPTCADHASGGFHQLIGTPAHDDDLQAVLVVKMNVHR